jgi:hypothetical protein
MENIVAELKEINKKLDIIISTMNKPESKFGRILETAGTVVSIFSILSIIEIIRNWLGL